MGRFYRSCASSGPLYCKSTTGAPSSALDASLGRISWVEFITKTVGIVCETHNARDGDP